MGEEQCPGTGAFRDAGGWLGGRWTWDMWLVDRQRLVHENEVPG